MSAIRRSRQEPVEPGIKTTYAVARRIDDQFCIVDANPIYGKHTYLTKPPLLPLHGKVYPDYQSTFGAIVAELTREAEGLDGLHFVEPKPEETKQLSLF